MQITHLGHSAALVETDDARILIDPGNFSDAWHGVTDLDAVLLTHQHPDHLDPQQLPALLAANPGVRVFAEPSILDKVAAGDLPGLGNAGEALPADRQEAVGDVLITAVGGQHAVIHRDLPRIGNVGFLLSSEGQPTRSSWPFGRHCSARGRHPGRARVRAVGGDEGDGGLRPGRGRAGGFPDP